MMFMDENIKEIHITDPLTSRKIMELMDEYPNLNKITICPSLFNRIPKTYLDALNKLEINVETKYNWDAKSKYSIEKNRISSLAKDGKTPKEISKNLQIPLSRVYYLLSKNKENIKFNNYRRKYDLNKRKLVKSMKNEGVSPKEISSKLNIPIRTVYYILNRK